MNEARLKFATDSLSKGHITKDEFAQISLQEGAINKDEYQQVTMPGWKKTLSKVGGFGLETGGLIGGEMLGGVAGALTSPVTGPVGPIAGKMAGGAGGEALGELGHQELNTALGIRKQPDLREISQILGKGAVRGAEYSAGGQLFGAGLKAAKPVLAPMGRGLAKLAEFSTGKPARVFERIAENPRMILPEWMGGAKTLETVKPEYKALRENIVGSPKELGVMEGEVKGLYEDSLSKSKAMINDIDKALKRGEEITAKEAIPAYEWVNSRISKLLPSEGAEKLTADAKEELFSLQSLKKGLQGEIKRSSPDFWKKIVEYGQASTKKQASQFLPGGYGGKYLARRLVPIVAGFMSPATALGVTAGMSPRIMSGLTALGSSGMLNAPLVKSLLQLRRNKNENINS